MSIVNTEKNQNNRLFGKKQESHAAAYLNKKGLKLIQSNYQCRRGEIDLVMIDNQQQLVFVEVRYRSRQSFGTAVETIGRSKQQKIRSSAAYFLLENPEFQHLMCRFDVVGISPLPGSCRLRFDWIANAFF